MTTLTTALHEPSVPVYHHPAARPSSHSHVPHSICVTFTARCCPRCLPSKAFYFLMEAPGHLEMVRLFTLASTEAQP